MQATAPSPDWTFEDLQRYAVRQVRRYELADVRKARDVFRAGHALALVRDRLKTGREWVAWQKRRKLKRSTVHQAIRVYEHFQTEEAIKGQTIMEAKRAAGIIKPKPEPAPEAAGLPEPIRRLDKAVRDINAALAECKEGVADGTLDREAVAKLVEELAEVVREYETAMKPSRRARAKATTPGR